MKPGRKKGRFGGKKNDGRNKKGDDGTNGEGGEVQGNENAREDDEKGKDEV